jgi:hypothetical protein
MGRDHLEKQGLVWRIILEWIFKIWDGGIESVDLGQNRDRWRTLGCGNEPPDFIKCREFLK